MDLISITALNISTTIGVYAWEQRIKQNVLLDITIRQPPREYQDKIENTIDYAALCKEITYFIEQQSFALIETLAEESIKFIKEKFNITEITLRISKPSAVKNASNVSFTLTR